MKHDNINQEEYSRTSPRMGGAMVERNRMSKEAHGLLWKHPQGAWVHLDEEAEEKAALSHRRCGAGKVVSTI